MKTLTDSPDRRRPRRILFLLFLLLAFACDGGQGGEDHEDHGDHEDHDGHEEHRPVGLAPDRAEGPGIVVATAGPGELVLRLPLSGEVRLNEDRVAHIVPSTPGIVREVAKTFGDVVNAGEVLAILESPELGRAKLSYLASRQRLELATTDLARMELIHRNTLRMLALLDDSPPLEELRNHAGEEMGENRSRLVSAYSEFRFSKSTWERERRLYERDVTSEQDYLEAENGAKKAEAEYETTRDSIRFALGRDRLAAQRERQLAEFEVQSVERELHVLGMTEPEVAALEGGEVGHEKLAWYALRAPFAGTVVEKHITLGEMLETSESAFTIADTSAVWVDLTVYQKDLAQVAAGQTVRVRTGVGASATATIAFLSPLVDEATRAATARLTIPNEGGHWRPGMFVTAVLEHERAHADVLVPENAVQTLDGEPVVFVRTEEGFEPRHVEIGRRSDAGLEIRKGLTAGERYVAKGAFALKAELQKGSFAHAGHNH